jgi:phasin family protein
MVANFESVQQLGKDQFEAVSAATAALTKGLQGIATETTDYSKKSFEKTRELAEKLVGVKKIDEAVALQSEFAKSSYEDFVAEATKLGELYTALAKEVFKPIETAAKAFTPAS